MTDELIRKSDALTMCLNGVFLDDVTEAIRTLPAVARVYDLDPATYSAAAAAIAKLCDNGFRITRDPTEALAVPEVAREALMVERIDDVAEICRQFGLSEPRFRAALRAIGEPRNG